MNQKTDMYSEIGGLRSGTSYWMASNWTIPFAKISLSTESICLSTPLEKVELFKNQIDGFSLKWGLFGKGIRFHHNCPKHDKFILFWSLDYENLVKVLIGLGYSSFKPESGKMGSADHS